MKSLHGVEILKTRVREKVALVRALTQAQMAQTRMKASLTSSGNELVGLIVAIIIGISVALYIGGVLSTSLTGDATVTNAINTMVTDVVNDGLPVFGGVVAIGFIALLYFLVKKSGMMGNSGSGHKQR